MTLDPVTLWIYRGVLVAVGLACLALAFYVFSRAVQSLSRVGTASGLQGLDGLVGWLSGWKTYIIAAAVPVVVALNQFGYISDATMNLLLVLLGGGGLATLRAGQAKAEKVAGQAVEAAEHAVTAAKISAVKVEDAVSTVVAKVEAAPAPVRRVEPLDAPARVPRVPRERDLEGPVNKVVRDPNIPA